ncbi:MAG: efflux RND transporter periplasmic adaptor subunit, partial [Blastocatellia bacterium]|nr:efflux RND transporter periplasmic adaptor subunit [Blastocatellia bacterium]
DSLGDGYRVEAKIVIWEKKNVLKLPISALFRKDDDWYVFVVENKLTKLCAVKIDHITDSEAEVISGLKQNQIVITHPSNQVIEGIVVTTSAGK